MTLSPTINNTNLIWIDLEMTGLSPDQDRIIEIATIVTDSDLNILAEGPVMAIKQSEDRLAAMDHWNRCTHIKSGLVKRVRQSPFSERDAEQRTLAFLRQWLPPDCSPICGNSIGQDRRFLYRYMPELENFFHYRAVDVSTLKELAQRWKPEILEGLKKKSSHEALEDIRESIAELDYYRQHFIRSE